MVEQNLDIIFGAKNNAGPVLSSLSGSLLNVKTLGIAAGAAMAGMFIKSSIDSAWKFEEAIAKVNTITETTAETIATLRSNSIIYGKSAVDLANAMYEIESASYHAEDAMLVLDAATQASVAGWVSVENAADVVTDVLNSYNIAATESTYVTDVLLKSVELGKLKWEDYQGALGRIMPTANNLGVSLEELMGILDGLTKAGLSFDMAVTGLLGGFTALLKPTQELEDAVKTLGYESTELMLEQEGVLRTMQILGMYTNGSSNELAEMFSRVRGLNAVMSILADGGEDVTDIIDQLGDSAGTTSEKLEGMADTSERSAARMKSAWENLKISFGEKVGGPVAEMMDALSYILGNDVSREAQDIAQYQEWQSKGYTGEDVRTKGYREYLAEYERQKEEAELRAMLDKQLVLPQSYISGMQKSEALWTRQVQQRADLMTLQAGLELDVTEAEAQIAGLEADLKEALTAVNISFGQQLGGQITSFMSGMLDTGRGYSIGTEEGLGRGMGFVDALEQVYRDMGGPAEGEEMLNVAREQLQTDHDNTVIAEDMFRSMAAAEGWNKLSTEKQDEIKATLFEWVTTLSDYKNTAEGILNEMNPKLDTANAELANVNANLGNVKSAIDALDLSVTVNLKQIETRDRYSYEFRTHGR